MHVFPTQCRVHARNCVRMANGSDIYAPGLDTNLGPPVISGSRAQVRRNTAPTLQNIRVYQILQPTFHVATGHRVHVLVCMVTILMYRSRSGIRPSRALGTVTWRARGAAHTQRNALTVYNILHGLSGADNLTDGHKQIRAHAHAYAHAYAHAHAHAHRAKHPHKLTHALSGRFGMSSGVSGFWTCPA